MGGTFGVTTPKLSLIYLTVWVNKDISTLKANQSEELLGHLPVTLIRMAGQDSIEYCMCV